VNETGYGIPVCHWLKCVLVTGSSGPAFCDEEGIVLASHDMNYSLHGILGDLLSNHPTLFLADVKTRADIEENMMCTTFSVVARVLRLW
jgi:hypothetical protein